MAEVLAARPKDIGPAFANSFEGMTAAPVTQGELIAARAALTEAIITNMPQEHRQFLVSFEAGAPDWSLLPVPKADKLPAIRWRVENLAKLTKNKRIALVAQLEGVLGQQPRPDQFTLFAEPGTTAGRQRKAKKKV
jgi:hypothetical protein